MTDAKSPQETKIFCANKGLIFALLNVVQDMVFCGLGLGSLGSCWWHSVPVWAQFIVLYREELDWNREGREEGKCE